MRITAVKPEDLPFRKDGSDSCDAARSGSAVMKISGLPGTFEVQFIGTGVAVIPSSTQKVFDVNDATDSVEMLWYQNRFIGRHWLLGDFKIDLAEDKDSKGNISVIDKPKIGSNVVNTNEFYFDFQFKRFPSLNMANVTPILNNAVVSGIPPIGSVFKLLAPVTNKFEFKFGSNRVIDKEDAPTRIVQFNQCDIVVFPERNVGIELIEQRKLSDNSYDVTVEIENITDVEAVFAYFTVVHYVGVNIENDYGLLVLSPHRKQRISYKVVSKIANRKIDLPFFTGLYKPEKLNGSKSLPLFFEF